MKLACLMAAVLMCWVASPAAADDETSVDWGYWVGDSRCLQVAVFTGPGDAATYQEDPAATPQYAGLLQAELASVADAPGLAWPDCVKPEPKPAGHLAIRAKIWLRQADGTRGVCMDTQQVEVDGSTSPWLTNSVDASHFWTRVQHPVDYEGPGPCGEGWYKIQAWFRKVHNGNWVPAAKACKANGQQNCLHPLLTDWHWLPADECHVHPTPATCPV